LEKLWAEHIGSLSEHGGETYKGFPGTYWSFNRQPVAQSLSRLSEQDEQVALQMFQTILKYAGLGQNGNGSGDRRRSPLGRRRVISFVRSCPF